MMERNYLGRPSIYMRAVTDFRRALGFLRVFLIEKVIYLAVPDTVYYCTRLQAIQCLSTICKLHCKQPGSKL